MNDEIINITEGRRPACHDKGIILAETPKAVLLMAFNWYDDGYDIKNEYERPNPATSWIPKTCCILTKTDFMTPNFKYEIYRITILTKSWFSGPQWKKTHSKESGFEDDTGLAAIASSFGMDIEKVGPQDNCFFCGRKNDNASDFACSECKLIALQDKKQKEKKNKKINLMKFLK